MPSYKVGNFQLNTHTGTQSVTGLGFAPKGVLFFVTPYTVSIDSPAFSNNLYMGLGMMDSTNKFAIYAFKPDADAGLGSASVAQSQIHCILGGVNQSSMYHAVPVSLDLDGFTINITAAPGDSYWVGYIAWGGPLISGVKVGTFDGRTGTGTQSVTNVGFRPTGLIAMTLDIGGGYYTSGSASVTNAAPAFGFSDGTHNHSFSGFLRNDGGSVKVSGGMHSITKILAPIANDATPPPSFNGAGAVTSFDADGFTLNWTTAINAVHIFYLAFAGPAVSVGSFAMPTTTGAFTPITGLAFAPEALMMFSGGQPAAETIQGMGQVANAVGMEYSLAATTGGSLNQSFAIGGWSKDFTTTGDERSFSHSAHVVRLASLSNNQNEEAAMSAFTGNGATLASTFAVGSSSSIVSYMAMSTIYDPGGGNQGSGSGDPNSPDSSFLFNML